MRGEKFAVVAKVEEGCHHTQNHEEQAHTGGVQ